MKNYLLIFITFCFVGMLQANQKTYPLLPDPIDVVIVSHPKDKGTLNKCIEGIRENGNNINRVIVVSSEKLTDRAEWFDERDFPFSKDEVASVIVGGDKKEIEKFYKSKSRGPGWYLQQLLKLYSPFVIPDISSNVLVIDADTIFLNPVTFLNDQNGGLFCVSHSRRFVQKTYFEHAERLVPGYSRIFPEVYSVCHHMLFQRPILMDLFEVVEETHGKPFWEAFCEKIDFTAKQGASEYEIYYNFALTHTDQVDLRDLKWTNSGRLNDLPKFKREGYHYVSFHTYLRNKIPKSLFD